MLNIYTCGVTVGGKASLTVYALATRHDKARQAVTERLLRDGYATAEIVTCEFLTRDDKGTSGETHIRDVDGE